MTSIQPFDFKGSAIRALADNNGDPWFIAKDACDILDIRTDTVRSILDDDEVQTINPNSIGVDHNGGRAPLIVSEGGLYGLIFKSRKPVAQEFKRWVKHEVLPSIRKHGGYMAGQERMTPEQMALASMQWLHSMVDEQARQLEAQAPKVLFADAVNASQTSILVGQLAKIIQQNGVPMGQRRLFAWLRERHYLSSRKGEDYNMPLQKYIEQGLFEIKESTHTNPDGVTFTTRTVKVTGKGQQYFVNKFLGDKGIGKAA
jgi:anti-repressor protein